MPNKVAEYIQRLPSDGNRVICCRHVNCWDLWIFWFYRWAIRYGLSAIKSVGRPVINAMVEAKREKWELYRLLKDYPVLRGSTGTVNKRAIENFIKAGALDCLEGEPPSEKMNVYGHNRGQYRTGKKRILFSRDRRVFLIWSAKRTKRKFEIRNAECWANTRIKKVLFLAFEKRSSWNLLRAGHPSGIDIAISISKILSLCKNNRIFSSARMK